MMKLRYIFLALVLASVLAVTACGGEETTAPVTTAQPPMTVPTTPATTKPETTMPTPQPPTEESDTTSPSSPTPPTVMPPPTVPPITEPVVMAITSAAFEHEGDIPVKYSCDGANVSPELNWTGVPEGTQSFVLIMDDPDAPGGTFTHWVIYNIPADATSLEENMPKTATLASGALQGRNSFGEIGYGGPCPPRGQSHRYFFKLYALDITLDLEGGASKAQVLAAMEEHILAEVEIMGNFQS